MGPKCVNLIGKKTYFEQFEANAIERGKTFEHILSSAMRNFELIPSDISIPTFGEPVDVAQTTAKSVRKFHTSDCANPKILGDPSPSPPRLTTDHRLATHTSRFWKDSH